MQTTTDRMLDADRRLMKCLSARNRRACSLIPCVAPGTPKLVAQHGVQAALALIAEGKEVPREMLNFLGLAHRNVPMFIVGADLTTNGGRAW